MKKICVLLLAIISYVPLFADGIDAPVPGGNVVAPIDTNSIILVIAAIVLIIAMVAYKKISKKVA